MLQETSEIQRDLPFFLKASYWDGHALGDGQESWPHILPSAPRFGSSLRAHMVMQERIHLSTEVRQVFDNGAVFNPNHHPEGTLILFDREFVGKHSLVVCAEGALQPNLIPEVSLHKPSATICTGEEHYVRNLLWGVVVAGRGGKLLKVRLASEVKAAESKGLIPGEMLTMNQSLATGQVVHYTDEGIDMMYRTRRVEIRAFGKPERQPGFLSLPGIKRD